MANKRRSKKTNSAVISAVLYMLLGVLLIVFRSQTIGWAMTIAGAIFVVFGILDLLKNNWNSGAVSLVIGIAILVLGWALTEIVLLVLGVLLALKGLIDLIDALKRKKKTLLSILFPLLTIIIGVILAFGNGLDIILVIVGVLLLADGLLGFIGSAKR